MKKIIFLFTLSGALIIPNLVFGAGPVDCCELSHDISWTKKIGTLGCSETKPCIFKNDKAVGSTIVTGSCGATANVTLKCDEAGAFTEVTTPPAHWDQALSCISNDTWGILCLLNTLYNVATWFFVILVSLSGIYVVMGSMNLLMSGGDPAKIDKGRGYIMYAIIGLILGFLARVIPSIVKLAVG